MQDISTLKITVRSIRRQPNRAGQRPRPPLLWHGVRPSEGATAFIRDVFISDNGDAEVHAAYSGVDSTHVFVDKQFI